MLLFGFKMQGRSVLVGLTLFGLFFWPPLDTPHVAAAESRAVGTLGKLRSALESYKVGQPARYPQTLPSVDSSDLLRRTYRFEYVPSFSADGTIDTFVIRATPVRRACGCTKSFAIANDGRLYYTSEARAATFSDQPLERK
jgi:hypothetical protein